MLLTRICDGCNKAPLPLSLLLLALLLLLLLLLVTRICDGRSNTPLPLSLLLALLVLLLLLPLSLSLLLLLLLLLFFFSGSTNSRDAGADPAACEAAAYLAYTTSIRCGWPLGCSSLSRSLRMLRKRLVELMREMSMLRLRRWSALRATHCEKGR